MEKRTGPDIKRFIYVLKTFFSVSWAAVTKNKQNKIVKMRFILIPHKLTVR